MRRVILVLLVLLQLIFFLDFIINTEVIFVNIYIWLGISIISAYVGYRSIRSEPNLDEHMLTHKIISYALFYLSLIAIGCIIYIFAFKSYII